MAMQPDISKAKYRKSFSDDSFWNKLRSVGVKAGAAVVYPALVLYYVLRSDEVSGRSKLYIMGALGYLILPLDLIPDFLPFFGYADDLAAIVAAYKFVSDVVTPGIKSRARAKASEWFGLAEVSRAEDKLEREVDDQ